jgi:glycosyltransferase involved in cell wall biosynthesis
MPRGAWRVDLAGAGPLAPEIQQRIAEARLGEHVKLVGRVRDVRDFWRDRHVAMLLSDSEGMPNALLESAFAGRPAIATRTGGSPEVVRDGGILVELNDPAATAAAMQSLMSDAARRERMAIAAWRHVAAAYSMSAMVEGHVAAIDETRALAKPVFA